MTKPSGPEGLISVTRARSIREELARGGRQLVWTNGCFDFLHIGHVIYLQNARSFGDALVVGLNSDRSFRRWKKRPGPVIPEIQRAGVLLGLASVDYVLLFDDASPRELLDKIQPHIFVKGDDYTLETLDPQEKAVIEGYGGQIRFCHGEDGVSTTQILHRILRLFDARDFEP